MIKNTVKTTILLLLIILCSSGYPVKVVSVLEKAGKNRAELEKVLLHYKNDSLKLKAAYFLIENMDIHYSQSYRWLKSNGEYFYFNEFNYKSYKEAVSKFKSNTINIELTTQTYNTPDIKKITSEYLINNIDNSFILWKNKWNKRLSFEMFCEYVLPYRIMDEPITEWRNSYSKHFSKSFVKCQGLNVNNVCTFLSESHKGWFSDIFNLNIKKEPQHALSAQQILFRQQGYCEDMSNWGVFMLRTLGIAAAVDFTPYWATSTGGHFWQVAFDENGKEIPFFMGDDTPSEFLMRREPSKVLRLTFSKQKNTLASIIDTSYIPTGFLRMKNYVDVTKKYWKTANISIRLPKSNNSQICFVSVFNGVHWRTVWWGKKHKGIYRFKDLTCGVVYLPIIYQNGKETPVDNPYIIKSDGTFKCLHADLKKKKNIIISQHSNYLLFRPQTKYTLYFWDTNRKWVYLGQKTSGTQIKPSDVLTFENCPSNALYILLPEHSKGKERPFTIDDKRIINYW